MTEPPAVKADIGPLLWPRFYGPSIEYNRSYFNKFVLATLTVLASALFLATGILLIWGRTDPRWGALNIAIAIGIPAFYWYLDRSARTSMDHESMGRRGDLDWDLHENGFLVRDYSEGLPGHVRTAFVGFERFSKAYVNVDDQNARLVWELAKAAARKAGGAGGEAPEPDFVWDERARAQISGFIWLVFRESGTAELRLDRGRLDDPERFESILRQKMKDVE